MSKLCLYSNRAPQRYRLLQSFCVKTPGLGFDLAGTAAGSSRETKQRPFTCSRVLPLRISEKSAPRSWGWGQYLQTEAKVVFLCSTYIVVGVHGSQLPSLCLGLGLAPCGRRSAISKMTCFAAQMLSGLLAACCYFHQYFEWEFVTT